MKKATPARARLRLAGLLIDLERSTVQGLTAPSELTPRAEALLLLLARNANQFVLPSEIMQTVWAGRDVEDAVISNGVWQLRKALGPSGKEILQNRTKRGYMLVVPPEAWIVEEYASADVSEIPTAGLLPEGATAQAEQGSDPVPSAPSASDAVSAPPSHQDLQAPQGGRDTGSENRKARPATSRDAGAGAEPNDTADERAAVGTEPRSRRLERWRWPLGIAVGACILVGVGIWRWAGLGDSTAAPIALAPEAEMTVSVQTPQNLHWLRAGVLSVAVDEVYRRDGRVLLFEKPQTTNPFAGPHFESRIRPRDPGMVEAEMVLRYRGRELRERIVAPSQKMPDLARRFLGRHLQPARYAATPAFDEFVMGMTADLQHRSQMAMLHYERALARDPKMIEARLALAVLKSDLGRTRSALELLQRLQRADLRERLSPLQLCTVQTTVADIDPSLIEEKTCADASRRKQEKDRDHVAVLRELSAVEPSPLGATQWLENEELAIRGHIGLREFRHALDQIANAERVADKAGWDHVRALMLLYRATIAAQQGQTAESSRLDRAAIERFEAGNDLNMAIFMRLNLMTSTPPLPGAPTEARRRDLWRVIDEAQAIGSVWGEVNALRQLLDLDKNRPERWTSHLERIHRLARSEYAERNQIQERLYLLKPILVQRRYARAIEEVRSLQRGGASFAEARILTLSTLASAHFRRDELAQAQQAVEAMQKEKFDIGYANTCLYAWLFAESDRPDRTRMMLEKCDDRTEDSVTRAKSGDFGLIGLARSRIREGQPERGWALLRPRIEALLTVPELSVAEAGALLDLARHATATPQADLPLLMRALRKAEPLAAQDGADPRLRFGLHTLRWRLCIAGGRADCGPALPSWALEDRFEARLAAEYAASLGTRR